MKVVVGEIHDDKTTNGDDSERLGTDDIKRHRILFAVFLKRVASLLDRVDDHFSLYGGWAIFRQCARREWEKTR